MTTQCARHNDGDKHRRRIPLWSDKEEGKGGKGVKIGKSLSEEVTPELSLKRWVGVIQGKCQERRKDISNRQNALREETEWRSSTDV